MIPDANVMMIQRDKTIKGDFHSLCSRQSSLLKRRNLHINIGVQY